MEGILAFDSGRRHKRHVSAGAATTSPWRCLSSSPHWSRASSRQTWHLDKSCRSPLLMSRRECRDDLGIVGGTDYATKHRPAAWVVGQWPTGSRRVPPRCRPAASRPPPRTPADRPVIEEAVTQRSSFPVSGYSPRMVVGRTCTENGGNTSPRPASGGCACPFHGRKIGASSWRWRLSCQALLVRLWMASAAKAKNVLWAVPQS